MKRQTIFFITFVMLLTIGSAAQADWFDGFESYTAGGGLHGSGGWAGWDGDSAFDASISDSDFYEGSQSLAIEGAADMVHEFSGYDNGVWTISCQMYIPAGYTGSTNFIVLNTYAVAGSKNWSADVHFQDGAVNDLYSSASLPLISGEWVELRLVIDMDNDLQTFYYGGDQLYQKSWTEGGSGGGQLNIGSVDLFANNASIVYYDNLTLNSGPVTSESTSMSELKESYR